MEVGAGEKVWVRNVWVRNPRRQRHAPGMAPSASRHWPRRRPQAPASCCGTAPTVHHPHPGAGSPRPGAGSPAALRSQQVRRRRVGRRGSQQVLRSLRGSRPGDVTLKVGRGAPAARRAPPPCTRAVGCSGRRTVRAGLFTWRGCPVALRPSSRVSLGRSVGGWRPVRCGGWVSA
jgi:hypothetical protein